MPRFRASRFPLGQLAFFVMLAAGCGPAEAEVDDYPQLSFSAQQFAQTESTVNALLSAEEIRFETTAIASLDRSQNLVRLESAWTLDMAEDERQLRLGDSVSNPGSWGSAVRFAGLQFGTPFTLRSDVLNTSRLALSGIAVVPTTADAILGAHNTRGNTKERGMSVRTPALAGANSIAVSANDAGGRRASFTQPLLSKLSVVDSGCSDYSLSVGRARVDYALTSNNYGPWFANTTLVCGAGHGLAIEAHGEYLEGATGLAGLNLTQSLGKLGAASVAFATSENVHGSGWLVRMGVQHSNELFEFNVRTRRQSPEFRELGEDLATEEAVAQRTLASVGAKLSDRNTLALAYTDQTHHDKQRVKIVGMSQTLELGRRGKVSFAANRAINESLAAEQVLSLNLSYLRAIP